MMYLRRLMLIGSGVAIILVAIIINATGTGRAEAFVPVHSTNVYTTISNHHLYQYQRNQRLYNSIVCAASSTSATVQQQQENASGDSTVVSTADPKVTMLTAATVTITSSNDASSNDDYQYKMMDDDDDDEDMSLSLLQTLPQSPHQPLQLEPQAQPIQEPLEQDRRNVLILLWFIAAISALDRVAMSVALVPMSYEYSSVITDTMKGLISSLFSIGYGLAIIPAGLFISCTSPKTLMTVGILIWSVATIVTPISADWILLTTIPILGVRAMVGMGEAILIPTVHRLLSVWTTSEQKSSGTWMLYAVTLYILHINMSISPHSHSLLQLLCQFAKSNIHCHIEMSQTALAFIFSGFHAGTIGAYLLSPYIMDVMSTHQNQHNDWRVLFYVYGTCGILLLIPWLLFAKDQPVTTSTDTTTSATSSDDDTPFTTTTSWDDALASYQNAPWKEFIQSKGVWGMLLAHCAKNWGLYTSLSWTPTFYAEQYNIGVRDSAWLSVMPSIAGALGGFIAGTLADQAITNMSVSLNDETTTQIRKIFQTVGLLGPAIALAALAYQLPEHAWVAQLYLMVAVGLQSFNAGGFEAGTQDKAGPRWIGMLYSVTSLPSVMGT